MARPSRRSCSNRRNRSGVQAGAPLVAARDIAQLIEPREHAGPHVADVGGAAQLVSLAPLAEVAGEFNRYNQVKFEVDAAAGDEPLSGVFAADRPESLARFLAKDESLRVERNGDRFVIRPSDSP